MVYEIIVDIGETPNKCTIAPLSDRADFRLFHVFGEGSLGPLCAPVLLHHEGECLTKIKLAQPKFLASIDCVWRRLPKILPRIRWKDGKPPTLAKIPDGFRTVYPRTGRPDIDPTGGLATIEAIFVASAMLGRWDPSLLAKYYFGRQFIDLNTRRFLELGFSQATDPMQLPPLTFPPRNSLSRRRNRGRLPKD